MAAGAIPAYVLHDEADPESLHSHSRRKSHHFSLAGVQMKFSMRQQDGRYHIGESGESGEWIVKTPSKLHKSVPLNEFTAMRLAEPAGVDIPEIRLVEMDRLAKLPPIVLPDERYAFTIRRFDREGQERVHTEDFAQVLVERPAPEVRQRQLRADRQGALPLYRSQPCQRAAVCPPIAGQYPAGQRGCPFEELDPHLSG
jgi:serine/threonine-protein kinase HipA